MKFLTELLSRGKKPEAMDIPYIGKVECGNGFSITIRGVDSGITMHSEDGSEKLFVKHYGFFLEHPSITMMEQKLAEINQKNKGKKFKLESDRSLYLTSSPGEGMMLITSIANLASWLADFGIIVPQEKLGRAISGDIGTARDRYFKPVKTEMAIQ